MIPGLGEIRYHAVLGSIAMVRKTGFIGYIARGTATPESNCA